MAGNGFAPKEQRGRARDTQKRDTLSADGKRRGFDLPENVLGAGEEWHAVTRQWWEAWQLSPQAVRMMTDVDWYFLLDTALMHNAMWSKGRWEFAAEVRLRAAKFGATPEDRLRLKLEVEVGEDFPVGDSGNPTNVTAIDRRKRLGG